MTDRELLELAAKAAGIKLQWPLDGTIGAYPSDKWWKDANEWDPLTDDGDAMRLAVKLVMSVEICSYEGQTYASSGKYPSVYAKEDNTKDPYAATRRAIVRAAAEIGKAMK